MEKTSRHNADLTAIIKHLMQQEGDISQAELARQTNIPPPTLYKLLTRQTTDPRASTLTALADFFNVSVDQLLGRIPLNTRLTTITSTPIPIISWHEATLGTNFIANLSPNNWQHWTVISQDMTADFALITRSAMEPTLKKGSLVIIKHQRNAQDGDHVLVLYPNTQEATLRKISIDGPLKKLTPLAAHNHSEVYTEKIKILGVVLETRWSY